MKHIRTALLLLAILLIGPMGHAQVTAFVHLTDNSTVAVSMDASGEIYFNNDQLVFLESALSGNTQSWAMDQVAKVTFDGEPNAIQGLSAGSLTLYPNPTHHSFHLAGIGSQPTPLAIYSVAGTKLLEGSCVDGDNIDISQFKPGIYFVRIGQQTVKLAVR